jgi:hypothetical protein
VASKTRHALWQSKDEQSLRHVPRSIPRRSQHVFALGHEFVVCLVQVDGRDCPVLRSVVGRHESLAVIVKRFVEISKRGVWHTCTVMQLFKPLCVSEERNSVVSLNHVLRRLCTLLGEIICRQRNTRLQYNLSEKLCRLATQGSVC